MKALIVGGNGFIGSHLADRLVADRWQVVVLDLYERRYDQIPEQVQFIRGDLNQLYLVREALIGVDVVFHLAWASIHEISNQDPAADVHSNLIPSIQLIDACRRSNVKRIVFTSSGGTVYGLAEELPIDENHGLNPVTAYGVTKLAVEKYLHMFHHLHGIDYAVIRPSVPYGPRQNPLGRQGAVAVFLYRTAKGLPITIWGDGSTSRDYFYVTDLVDALIAAATRPLDRDRVFNIGGTEEVSLNRLLTLVQRVVGREADVNYVLERKFDAPHIVLDTRRASQVLDWQPRFQFERGLELTWKWMSAAVD